MSPEIEKEFFQRWPGFFLHKDDPMKSLMGWGFDCGDGWRQIIFDLLSRLDALTANSVPGKPFEIEQVKQKSGGLRVYTNWNTDEIEAAIDAASKLSLRTCEVCGQPGTLIVSGGWWATRCEDHMPEETRENDPPSTGAKVAVFWLFRSRLVLDATDLADAEPWGDYLNAPSHQGVWARYQQERPAMAKVEYDGPPRGRVVYDSVRQQFFLYADRCILDIPELVAEILRRLHLPASTPVSPDDHYRCAACMPRTD